MIDLIAGLALAEAHLARRHRASSRRSGRSPRPSSDWSRGPADGGGGAPPARAATAMASRRRAGARGRARTDGRGGRRRRGQPLPGAARRTAARSVSGVAAGRCCSSSAIYVLFPKLVGARRRGAQRSTTRSGTGSSSRSASTCSRSRAYVALFRGVLGGTRDDAGPPPPRPARVVPDHDGRAGGHAHLLGRRAPAGSCSPTGRCARRACRAGARPAGWSRSSCCTYFVYLTRARDLRRCCCAPACCPGDAPLGGTSCPPAIAGGVIVVLPADRADPAGLRAPHRSASRGGYRRDALPDSASPRARPRSRPACAPRSPTCATRSAARWPSAARSGFWAANIGVLWASFEAFGGERALRSARAGLLRRHGRQPDPVAGRAAWARSTRA